ncbi:hypothetical protein CO230_00370 [Chryseobacterium sp. 6424]|nr:hypothetical protein CO230_00370 [Chryseobacterium sp. 6424]
MAIVINFAAKIGNFCRILRSREPALRYIFCGDSGSAPSPQKDAAAIRAMGSVSLGSFSQKKTE